MVKWLTLILIIAAGIVSGQEYRYVNTDNLIMRTSMDRDYDVSCILHAPTRVKIIPYIGDARGKQPGDLPLYHISVTCYDSGNFNDIVYFGYADRKYLVNTPQQVTVPGIDPSLDVWLTVTPLERYEKLWNCSEMTKTGIEYSNARQYRAPVYKGGNPLPLPPKPKPREYYTGPYGGCYYYNKAGKKVYVSSDFCKRK